MKGIRAKDQMEDETGKSFKEKSDQNVGEEGENSGLGTGLI